MAFGLDDYAIGKGLDLALRYGARTVRQIWAEKPIDRLLLLLHSEFAERTDVALDDLLALKTDQRIREPLEALLEGERFDLQPLGPALAEHFPHHPSADALGDAMARAAPRLAPFARDGSEAEAAISAQLEENFAEIRAFFARGEARLTELQEQVAGVQRTLDVRLAPHAEATTPSPTVDGPRAGAGSTGVRGADRPAVAKPEAQASAVVLLLERLSGSDEPDLAAAFELARAGKHEEAAERFGEQAERFAREQLSELEEECRENQAAALEAAGHEDRAMEVRAVLVRQQIERGSDLAVVVARRLLDRAPAHQRWRFEALFAQANWPEAPGPAMEALQHAAERTDREERVTWAAAAVEVMVMFGELERGMRVANLARDYPLDEGPRLRLELDWLEAVERTEGIEAAEPAWQTGRRKAGRGSHERSSWRDAPRRLFDARTSTPR